jgi:hypothetical protein
VSAWPPLSLPPAARSASAAPTREVRLQNIVNLGAACAQHDIVPDLDNMQPVTKAIPAVLPTNAPSGKVQLADGGAR